MSRLVSVGMPIHNEARHLEQALAALRAQDYAALEIIICDNASTDDTPEICRRAAAADPRVRYERHPQNIGATHNFQHALALARGDYFMWAAGHDLWSPNLVSACAARLDAHPDAVLAFASARWLDADGQAPDRHCGWSDTRGLHPIERFFTVLWGNMHPVYGLIRTAALRASGGMGDCVGADLALLASLSWKGAFVHAPEALWSRREVRATETYAQRLQRYRAAFARTRAPWLDRHFPLARLPLALLRTVWRAELRFAQKLFVSLGLLATFPARYLAGRGRHDG